MEDDFGRDCGGLLALLLLAFFLEGSSLVNVADDDASTSTAEFLSKPSVVDDLLEMVEGKNDGDADGGLICGGDDIT